jgi:hypothetical protein
VKWHSEYVTILILVADSSDCLDTVGISTSQPYGPPWSVMGTALIFNRKTDRFTCSLHRAEHYSRGHQLCSHSIVSQHFMEPKARPIQTTPPHPIFPRSIVISSTHLHLGIPSGLFHYGFPTNNLYAFLYTPIRATCIAHLIILNLIILIILGEGYKSRSSSLCSFLHPSGHFIPLR